MIQYIAIFTIDMKMFQWMTALRKRTVCRTGVGSNSTFCNGCTRNVVGSSTWQKDPDYRWTWCQGTACPLDGRPQREVQVRLDKLEVVASFFYQGDMLSATGGCELSTTTHVKTVWKKFHLEEVQGTATSFLFTPPLFQDTWLCVQLLCAGRNAPCQWDLAVDKAKTSNVCSEMTGQWSDRSAMSSLKTSLPPDPMSYLRSLVLRIWTSFWRREGSAGMDMLKAPMVQSRKPLTYRLMESVGLGGPRWRSSWQRDCREWKLSSIAPIYLSIYLLIIQNPLASIIWMCCTWCVSKRRKSEIVQHKSVKLWWA